MAYRVRKVPLTASRTQRSGSGTLARLPRRRGKLPARALAGFQTLARKLQRADFKMRPDLLEAGNDWLNRAGGTRRHHDILNALGRGEAMAVVVPWLRQGALPRMDEVLRLVAGLWLAKQLRNRRVGRVVTVLWPGLSADEEREPGVSAIVRRSGEIDDANFRGGDVKSFFEDLRANLPGTGFSPWLMDQLTRASDADPDLFKARLALRWFDDEEFISLPATQAGDMLAPVQGFDKRLARLVTNLPVLAVIREGPTVPTPGAAVSPLFFPSMGASLIEGKVEAWLEKFGVSVEDVLSGDARQDSLVRRQLPKDIPAIFSVFKERALAEILRLELGLNELGFTPEADIKKALDAFDSGSDGLRARAVAEAARETEINQRQLAKLYQYLLPDGRPQQEVVSLVHFMNFYGPDFLHGLRDSLEADDLRHQVVYLASAKD
ncbi:MAG: bacillithiol biosynthesis BshC [Planctomycetes bacterium]|nr:bacillithiol biosynthesis BshC [Planctomycetota bacterium]